MAVGESWRWRALLLFIALSCCGIGVEGLCEANWTNSNQNCYFFATQNQSWLAARQFCYVHNGELVDIESAKENQFIVSLSQNRGTPSFWIGLNDRKNFGTYQWSNGQSLSYNNWRTGEPNNPLDEDCAEMDKSGFWNDRSCSVQQSFVCKKPFATAVPKFNPPNQYTLSTDPKCGGWYIYTGFCYQYFGTKMTYDAAQKSCYALGGALVDILSTQELGFIKAYEYSIRATLTNFFIGLNDRLSENTFVWDDGTTQGTPQVPGLKNWGVGEPNNARHLEDCVEMLNYPSYTWNDISCTSKRSYMCTRSTASRNPNGTWSPFPAPALTSCPSAFTRYQHPSGAVYCYGLRGQTSSQRLNWVAAGTACRRMGPGFDLVSLHDHYEMNKVKAIMVQLYSKFLTSTYWIGLNDRSREGGFIYSDGSPTDYIHWGGNQPNNLQGRQDCVAIYSRYSGNWNDDACSTRHAYICKKTLKPKPLTSPTVSNKYCLAGWHQYGSYCYLVRTSSTDMATHSQAVANCTKYNGNLTSVHGTGEQGFLMSILGLHNTSIRVHIGINDMKVEGEFKWTDGTQVVYTNWGYNQPNDWRNVQDCTELDHNLGYWNDIYCNARRGYVCKHIRDQPTAPPPSTQPCPTGWTSFNKFCYKIPNVTLSAFAAEQYCANQRSAKQLGGNLATIRSRYDNFFITSLMFSQTNVQKAYFIGLNDRAYEGAYSWISGLPVTYANWAPHEPNDYYHGEDCVEIYSSNSRWNDRNCSWTRPFICMVPDKNQVTTPGAPSGTPPPPGSGGSATAACPAGWLKYSRSNICYGFFGSIHNLTMAMANPLISPQNWVSANARCTAMGAQLVSIHENYTNSFLMQQTQTYQMGWYSFWTGLNDRSQEGGYNWNDGSPLQFTAWATQEPNDWRGSEDCVEVLLGQSRAGWMFKWNDQSCTSRRPFICAFPAGSTYIAPTVSPLKLAPGASLVNCPVGWTASKTSCYSAVTGPTLTWTMADLKCQAKATGSVLAGGITPHLASIHTPGDHVTVALLAQNTLMQAGMNSTNFWIGLQDRAKENNFTWSDKSATDYLAWAAGQPNNWANSQDCVDMRLDLGFLWNDLQCAARRPYICSFSRIHMTNQPALPPAASVEGCKPGWKKNGLSCYRLFTTPKMIFNDAYLNCTKYGGDLYIANAAAEDKFVLGSVAQGSAYIWIGLSDQDQERYWRWADGSLLQYTNWGPNQPNNYQNEDCVALHSEDDKWYDRDCDEPHQYICEVPLFSMNYTQSSGGQTHSGLSAGGSVGVVFAVLAILAVGGLLVYFGVIRPRQAGAGSGRGSYSPANTGTVNGDDDDDAMLVAE